MACPWLVLWSNLSLLSRISACHDVRLLIDQTPCSQSTLYARFNILGKQFDFQVAQRSDRLEGGLGWSAPRVGMGKWYHMDVEAFSVCEYAKLLR